MLNNSQIEHSRNPLLALLVQRDLKRTPDETQAQEARLVRVQALAARQERIRALEEAQSRQSGSEARLHTQRLMSEAAHAYQFARTPQEKEEARTRLIGLGIKVIVPAPSRIRPTTPSEWSRVAANDPDKELSAPAIGADVTHLLMPAIDDSSTVSARGSSEGPTTPSVGNVVTVRDGSRVRITEIHPDGTFDSEPA